MRTVKLLAAMAVFASLSVPAALAVDAVAAASTKAPPLIGRVGPRYTISLETASGKRVRTLRPRIYRVRVIDRSGFHDFHLRGPRIDRVITAVRFRGTRTVRLRFRRGHYTFVCDPHASSMRGSFAVR